MQIHCTHTHVYTHIWMNTCELLRATTHTYTHIHTRPTYRHAHTQAQAHANNYIIRQRIPDRYSGLAPVTTKPTVYTYTHIHTCIYTHIWATTCKIFRVTTSNYSGLPPVNAIYCIHTHTPHTHVYIHIYGRLPARYSGLPPATIQGYHQ